MSNTVDIDGPLYIEVNKIWEEVYVIVCGTRLQAFKRIRDDVPASRQNKSETVVMQVKENILTCVLSHNIVLKTVSCIVTDCQFPFHTSVRYLSQRM